MAIQGFFTGDVKIRDLNGVLKAVNGIVEVATDAGTVTSVGLTVGSTGTDVNVANSPITTSGSITLNLPTASATNRGLLSSADWAIFSAKQGTITLTTTGNNGSATLISGTLNIPTYTLAGLGGISLTSLSASSPLLYNNTTGAFSIQVANGSQNGYLSSSDWTTFNSKQSALTFSSPLVNTSGTISIPAASGSVNGYLTSTDWTTFNNKQGAITLTTTGSSGAATLIGTTLNIPNYSGALTGYVPYTGATANVDLGEYELKAGQFTLDVSPTGTAAVGTTRWNNTIGSSETTLKGGTVLLKNGVDLVARVVNKVTPNTTLTKATYPAVRVSGAAGQRLAVAYAQANNDNNSADTIGLVTETIATNQEGFIMTVGQLLDINTTGSLQGETWVDGDVLYLSPTTAGALTNIKPTGATGHIVVMGYVEYAHANHGSIYVKVMNGWELDELHNVYISSPANNQGLFYESATSLWKNKSIATVLGYTPANAATTLTINGTTYDLSANRTWNVGTVTSVGASGPLTGGTITGSGTIGITQSTTSTDGYLSSTDWNTFNNKQPAGSYITALTGEATASGPGSATVTLSTSAVTGKLLTGLNLTGGGTIAATDSILQAFGKVQNQISGMVGGVTFQGTWNASTNTPTLTSSVGTKGYYYIVDVAGSTNLNGITDWKIGDWAIFNGTTWDKVDNTDAVSSVNGFTGAVSLTTSNIAEGTNLYYLDSRARLALSFTAGSGAYDNTTGVITIPTNTSQLTNGANYITLSSLSASSPLSYNSGTGAFSIQVANGSQNGYLSSSDWTTFNSKQNAITLTTTGSSGSSTLVGATLNVPTYTLSGLGGVPTSRQLTINGTAYDLSADRSWSVGTVTSIATSGPLTGGTITGSGTIGITQATTSTDGYLSSTDWNTFNSKQNALTNPVTGTGTTNYLSKFTGTSTIGNSLVYDNGTNVIIGNGSTDIQGRLQVTTSSGALLLNTDNSNFALLFRNTASSNKLWDISTVNNNLVFNEGGVGTRLFMQAGGNIGIGTITPTYLLDVNGTLRASANVTGTDNVAVFHNTNTTTAGTPVIALSTASTGPDAPADIRLAGTNTKGIRIYAADSTLTSTPLGAGFQMFSVSSTNFPGQMFFDSGANNSAFIAFRTAVTSGTITERMRITANGNISIGNTNDIYKLDVTSSAYRTFRVQSSDDVVMTFGSTIASSQYWSMTATANGSGQGSNVFFIGRSTSNPSGLLTKDFTLSSTGAATFSSSVTANSFTTPSTGAAGSTTWNLFHDQYAAGDFSFWAGSTTRLLINAAGNVGIGTTSPLQRLHVYNSASSSAAIFQGSSNSYIQLGVSNESYIGNVSGALLFEAGGSERMRISSGGNVGIGTTSPGRRLSIESSDTWMSFKVTGDKEYLIGQGTSDAFRFFDLSAGAERLRITSGGNVGIGTTSPTTYSLSGTHTEIFGGSTYSFLHVNTTNVKSFFATNESAGGSAIYTYSNHYLGFGTNNIERMKILSNGITLIYSVYSQTSGAAANVIVGSDGNLFRSTSSLKYKKNVENYTKGLSEVMKLRAVTYNGINSLDGNKQYAGLIAEEVHALGLTEFVQYANDGTPDALSYQNMVALLVKGMQELKAELDTYTGKNK